ncbi:bidirectional sugar transporter SWEET3b-like [Tasmannia lanceolata]|uniref:bidirectional sugar transporter SWEET3b-like n=1 Tax=Tasmannia lanceolata TaxID=3420 RepID=UPI00406406A3
MAETLRLAFGVLGDIVSLLRYLVPVFTFRRIIMNRSIEEFSCFPYVATLFGCLAYGWYGFPVVSIGWENLPLALINSTGALIQIIFILIYFWLAPAKKKKRVSLMLFPVIVVSCVTALVSTLALHDHQSRKVLVGSVGVVSTVIMQASPLVVVKRVIQTKSVEFMPFNLSLLMFISSVLWGTYGLLGADFFVAGPNLFSMPIGFFQLVLFCMYGEKKQIPEEPEGLDIEKEDGLTARLI